MKIVVLVKQVPDTEEERKLDLGSGVIDRSNNELVADEINERALEVALRQKDKDKKGTEVVVLGMGPVDATAALRKALSMGADSAIHVVDDALAGSDALRTSQVLAAALKSTAFDLLIAGNESTDGRGGLVPTMIAEHFSLAMLPSLDAVELSDAQVFGQVTIDEGVLSLQAALPAVISVTERAAEARFPNFKGIMTAKRKPLETLSLADLGLSPEPVKTSVVSTAQRPARAAGKKIVDEGNAANELAEFLVAGRLI